jgi:hypothetical protein
MPSRLPVQLTLLRLKLALGGDALEPDDLKMSAADAVVLVIVPLELDGRLILVAELGAPTRAIVGLAIGAGVQEELKIGHRSAPRGGGEGEAPTRPIKVDRLEAVEPSRAEIVAKRM